MPLYEYQCMECGDTFELLVGFSESKDRKTCPKCTSTNTTRLISTFVSSGFNTASSSDSSCSSSSRFT
ncbi:MAG: FmdB family transcriptional regulator [Anaerolinea sp.]|nr:FmdB family transcriptional regulator [Anaerolinea sp.]